MKMSKNTLLKKIEQGYRENYCNGEYTLNHTKSVINVMRLLFDLIDCNKDDMLEYYRTVETKETDETEKDVMKVKQDLNTRFGKKEHKNFIHDCEQVHKQMKAINNPNWHHVSLLTLENIDMDMTSEKWQTYIHVYRDLQQTLSYLRKCKTQDTYDTCFIRYIKRKYLMWDDGKISIAMLNYITAKLSMQNVESGVWASEYEEATNYHKSRRYNKSRAGR